MLIFKSIEIEHGLESTDCKYDFVQVIFGSVAEKYCEYHDKETPIISSGNTMTVFFHSDNSTSRPGFKATWKSVEVSGIPQGYIRYGGWWYDGNHRD